MNTLALQRLSHILAQGGVVAYPTEAVFGIGCDPDCTPAVQRLLQLKHRPWHKGMILIAAELAQLEPYILPLSRAQRARIGTSWPGPHTWVVPARPSVSPWLRGAHRTLAVRVTAHPLAAALCRHYGKPLVSTSANSAGSPPCRSAQQVRWRLGRELDALLYGATGGLAKPTTIHDLASVAILRSA